MKEVTYGWYPSVNDIYRSKGRPSSYHLECLYKHQNSMYYQGQVAPPEPELFVRGFSSSPPQTPQELRRKSRSVSVPKFKPVPKLHLPTPTQCWSTHVVPAETSWGVVDDFAPVAPPPPSEVNWPLPQRKPQEKVCTKQQALKEAIQQQQEQYFAQRHQTPQYAWGLTRTPRSSPPPRSATSVDLAWPTAQKVVPARPQSSVQLTDRQKKTSAENKHRPASSPVRHTGQSSSGSQGQRVKSGLAPTPPRSGRSEKSQQRSRIQSATVRRDKTPLPTRPVTACPSGREGSVVPQEEISLRLDVTKPPSRPAAPIPPSSGGPSASVQPAPVPFVYDVNDYARGTEEEEEEEMEVQGPMSTNGDNYDEIVNKFGWRAQVHGDPYKLKRPSKRLSYAVKCPEPELEPEPPSVHMETNEPFFYNTIPNRPMTFVVDKEWMSEVLLAKRLELQKKEGGIHYRYKNFAFVY